MQSCGHPRFEFETNGVKDDDVDQYGVFSLY